MSEIQFLPVVTNDMIRDGEENKCFLSPFNSKVFAGNMWLINEYMNGNRDSLPYTLNQEVIDIWAMYFHGSECEKSNHNSAFNMNKTRKAIVSYGKPAIMSCPFAGSCMEYCYAETSEKTYKGSLAVHVHNYAMVWSQSTDVIVDRIERGLDNRTVVVRLSDSGDITSYNEIKAWREVAINHPNTLFYGYSKATPYIYKLRSEFGQLPSNLVLNVSSTDNPVSMTFKAKLDEVYPDEFNTCWIVDSEEMHSELSELPFNNEEEMAMVGSSDFLIGLHGTFKKDTPEFKASKYFTQFETDTGIKIC